MSNMEMREIVPLEIHEYIIYLKERYPVGKIWKKIVSTKNDDIKWVKLCFEEYLDIVKYINLRKLKSAFKKSARKCCYHVDKETAIFILMSFPNYDSLTRYSFWVTYVERYAGVVSLIQGLMIRRIVYLNAPRWYSNGPRKGHDSTSYASTKFAKLVESAHVRFLGCKPVQVVKHVTDREQHALKKFYDQKMEMVHMKYDFRGSVIRLEIDKEIGKQMKIQAEVKKGDYLKVVEEVKVPYKGEMVPYQSLDFSKLTQNEKKEVLKVFEKNEEINEKISTYIQSTIKHGSISSMQSRLAGVRMVETITLCSLRNKNLVKFLVEDDEDDMDFGSDTDTSSGKWISLLSPFGLEQTHDICSKVMETFGLKHATAYSNILASFLPCMNNEKLQIVDDPFRESVLGKLRRIKFVKKKSSTFSNPICLGDIIQYGININWRDKKEVLCYVEFLWKYYTRVRFPAIDEISDNKIQMLGLLQTIVSNAYFDHLKVNVDSVSDALFERVPHEHNMIINGNYCMLFLKLLSGDIRQVDLKSCLRDIFSSSDDSKFKLYESTTKGNKEAFRMKNTVSGDTYDMKISYDCMLNKLKQIGHRLNLNYDPGTHGAKSGRTTTLYCCKMINEVFDIMWNPNERPSFFPFWNSLKEKWDERGSPLKKPEAAKVYKETTKSAWKKGGVPKRYLKCSENGNVHTMLKAHDNFIGTNKDDYEKLLFLCYNESLKCLEHNQDRNILEIRLKQIGEDNKNITNSKFKTKAPPRHLFDVVSGITSLRAVDALAKRFWFLFPPAKLKKVDELIRAESKCHKIVEDYKSKKKAVEKQYVDSQNDIPLMCIVDAMVMMGLTEPQAESVKTRCIEKSNFKFEQVLEYVVQMRDIRLKPPLYWNELISLIANMMIERNEEVEKDLVKTFFEENEKQISIEKILKWRKTYREMVKYCLKHSILMELCDATFGVLFLAEKTELSGEVDWIRTLARGFSEMKHRMVLNFFVWVYEKEFIWFNESNVAVISFLQQESIKLQSLQIDFKVTKVENDVTILHNWASINLNRSNLVRCHPVVSLLPKAFRKILQRAMLHIVKNMHGADHFIPREKLEEMWTAELFLDITSGSCDRFSQYSHKRTERRRERIKEQIINKQNQFSFEKSARDSEDDSLPDKKRRKIDWSDGKIMFDD